MTTSFNFNKWNIYIGWTVFFIAFLTYFLTMEPTVSFWDTGEYTATSAKLQVGHPPGAPFFQIMGAVFASFASDATQVAKMTNLVSVSASAFTILFMFWTITILVRKIVMRSSNTLDTNQSIAILGSGLIGSLTYTFSDTFWFNAVETEVYAMASLVMSLLLYLGLRWEQDMDSQRGNKWLLLISLVIGLSFGIHFMGFLAIPPLVLLYFFKKYKKITLKRFIIANAVAIFILLFVFKFSLALILKIFGTGEVYLVNTFGLPFHSGTILIGILFISLFYFGLRYTRRKNMVHLHTLTLSLAFLCIGFSVWIMLPIRSSANVVVNEHNPNNARELLAYYNMEQYGSRSIAYDSMYTEVYANADKIHPYKDDTPKYEADQVLGKYTIVNDWKNARTNLDDAHKGFFPRMWDTERAENYIMLGHTPKYSIKPAYKDQDKLQAFVADFENKLANGEIDYSQYHAFLNQAGSYLDIEKPSLLENLKFMFNYQIGYMYWRYFMWNFSGKQNDIQGKYDLQNGNWRSGIDAIDELYLPEQSNLPSDIKNNKARNSYYLIPFLLGILGLIFHFRRAKKDFWVLLVFFVLTGIAIQVYTNIRPFEPRERDYIVVGSFYIFAIWVGFGVYTLFDKFKAVIKPKILAPAIVILSLFTVPVLMASENWDDHDRSGRYTANFMAKAYLDSCQKDSILFTVADNDTFPLWYKQEIEGYRTDIRTLISEYVNTAWYIDQAKRKSYESDPLPISLTHEQYRYGTRDYIKGEILTEEAWDIQRWMDFVTNDAETHKLGNLLDSQGYDISIYPKNMLDLNFYPTNKIRIKVDKEKVLANNIVAAKDAHLIEDYIDITLPESGIYKAQLIKLNILANNNWERPIYFAGGTTEDAHFLWLQDYLQLEGLTYKFVPIKNASKNNFDIGKVNTDIMYANVMEWDWMSYGNSDIYHDAQGRRQSITFRNNLARLMEALIAEGKHEKALSVIDLAVEKMPVDVFGYYTFVIPFVEGYYMLDEKEKGRALAYQIITKYKEQLAYYSSLKYDSLPEFTEDILYTMDQYNAIVKIMIENDSKNVATKELRAFNNYVKRFEYFLTH
ncbi:DUF2723 domain-containing protein [Kordia sp.]|uniref:glycosyltransferase family 117 protein n=1 Tax=Kordia sp. TaxID=1965332 RepID=UPI003B59A4DA